MALTLSYDEQLALLDRIVADGLTKLLTEARQNEHLDEPYGRTVEPTPLITEEEFVQAGGLQGCLPDEPNFNFQYGFNPLQYLSKFISWSHPDSVEGRRQEKLKAVERLTARATHANTQLATAISLQDKIKEFSSGIYWGPFVSPIPFKEDPLRNLNDSVVIEPTCSVIVMCKALKTGFVTLQLSQLPDFSSLEGKVISTVIARQSHKHDDIEDIVSLEDIVPTKVTFSGLQFATQYYVRGFLSDTDERLNVPPQILNEDGEPIAVEVAHTEVPYSQATRFWTLPSDDVLLPEGVELTTEIPSVPVSIMCFGQQPTIRSSPGRSLSDCKSAVTIASTGPVYTALLGDLTYSNSVAASHSVTSAAVSSSGALSTLSVNDNRISSIYSKSSLFNSATQSLMRNSCALIAPRDSSDGARRFVFSEEVVHKQFRHDLRRYNKKYPPAGSSQTHKGKGTGPSKTGNAASVTLPAVPPPPTIKRLPLTDALQSMLELFPVDFTEEYDPIIPSAAVLAKIKDKNQLKALKEPVILGSRMLYRSIMIGPDVQVFLLDMRGAPVEGGASYLGKEQATWLTEQLLESSCLWKIVMCGYSFGVVGISNQVYEGSTNEVDNFYGLQNSVPLATRSGDVNDDEAPQTKTKQFQLQVPDETVKPTPEEDTDEIYMRSKYSLPFILASVQKKYTNGAASHIEEPVDDNTDVNLSSGIVLLTSGVCKLVQPGSALSLPHSDSHPRETVSPSFISAYSGLLGTASDQHTLIDQSVGRRVKDAYCVEIGLGSGNSLSQPSEDIPFGYLTGFDASTLFLNGDRTIACESTGCKLSLAADGSLQVSLVATDLTCSVENGALGLSGKVLFEVTLRTHLLDSASLEETEDGTSTVQEHNNGNL